MGVFLLNISFHFDYLPLLVVIAIAWIVPIMMSLLKAQRVPTVIVEIIFGFLVGYYLLDFASEDSVMILDFLALTGFIFLMFLSGLEIDVDQIILSLPRKKLTLSRYLRNPLLVGLTYFLITLFLAMGGAYLLSLIVDLPSVWYFALIMITTSVGIIFPVLKNRGETSGHFGQMMIITAAIADILSIVLFTFTAYIIRKGFRFELLLVIGLFILFYIFYVLGKRLNLVLFRRISFQLSHAASQISIRGTLLLILIFVVLAQYLGVEVILLGAFLSGLLLSLFLHKDRSLLMLKLDGMGFGFFIPIFFIMVGAKFEPGAFAEFDNSLLLFLILLLITLYAVKIIPSLLWAKLFGTQRAIAGGFLMASRLSLIIAAAAIGLDLGIITPGINASFIFLAVLTCIFSPLIYNNLNPTDRLAGAKTVIIGGSSIGVLLARRLKMHGKMSVIIEPDEKRFHDIKSKGLDTVQGSGMDANIYDKIKLNPENYVVVETGSDNMNINICEFLRTELRHERIISKSGNSKAEEALRKLDVEFLDARRVLATTIESLILMPTTYHALVDTFEDYRVEEIELSNKEIDGSQVKDIPFHKDGTIILVRRGSHVHVPHGDTYLRIGDILTVFGSGTALDDTRKKLLS
ncbi:MAG: cation:proton antiporter [Bacteroidota bacterium]|nr:cation:proton antiporter [Bacteroidota bacterium]